MTNIEKIRKEMGLSQKEFSIKYGINVHTLQAWEQQTRKTPSYIDNLFKYILKIEAVNKKKLLEIEKLNEDIHKLEVHLSRYEPIHIN